MSNRTSPRVRPLSDLKYLLQGVKLLHGYAHGYFGCLLNFSSDQKFVQDVISLLKVENNVQFTHLKQIDIPSIRLEMSHTSAQFHP